MTAPSTFSSCRTTRSVSRKRGMFAASARSTTSLPRGMGRPLSQMTRPSVWPIEAMTRERWEFSVPIFFILASPEGLNVGPASCVVALRDDRLVQLAHEGGQFVGVRHGSLRAFAGDGESGDGVGEGDGSVERPAFGEGV